MKTIKEIALVSSFLVLCAPIGLSAQQNTVSKDTLIPEWLKKVGKENNNRYSRIFLDKLLFGKPITDDDAVYVMESSIVTGAQHFNTTAYVIGLTLKQRAILDAVFDVHGLEYDRFRLEAKDKNKRSSKKLVRRRIK